MLEKNIGELPADKRKKKMLTTTLGFVTVHNYNPFSSGNCAFQIIAVLQDLMIYAGTLGCYGKSSEILEKFLSLQVYAAQVCRLTGLYREELGQQYDFTQRSHSFATAGETLSESRYLDAADP